MTALAARVLLIVAASLAARRARRRPAHRPIARFLAFAVIADLACWLVARAIADAPVPYRGGARALYHVEQALFLGWPAGLAAAAVQVFLRRRTRPIVVGWGAIVAALALAYPALRGPSLGWAYAGAHLVALLASAGAGIAWALRREWPEIEHVSAFVLIALAAVLFLGPYWPPRLDPFGQWGLAQIVFAALYLLLIAVHLMGASWRRPTSSWGSASRPSLH